MRIRACLFDPYSVKAPLMTLLFKRITGHTFTFAFAVSLAATLLSGCATSQHASMSSGSDEAIVSDPIEPFNRAMLSINEGIDAAILTPIDILYRLVVPEVGRKAVGNVLDNLKSPVYLANEVMQGDMKGAGTVVKRFAINTVAGVGGIVDVAEKQGIKRQPEDFGQTMATWGVGSGPYIVLPLFGPSTARDAVGLAGDWALDPLNWYLMNTDKDGARITRTALTVIDAKDRTRDAVEDLRRNSGDYYTALKSVYMQRRSALISDASNSDATTKPASLPDIP